MAESHPTSDPTAHVTVTVTPTPTVAVLASGMPGPAGREIELRTTATHIEWRLTGATSWHALVALSELEGPEGPEGRVVELRSTTTHLQWRYVGDVSWVNLLDLSTITNETQWTYVHNQEAPAALWSIPHGLTGYPSVTVVDSGNTVVEGDITYLSNDSITIEFSSPFGGKAFLS